MALRYKSLIFLFLVVLLSGLGLVVAGSLSVPLAEWNWYKLGGGICIALGLVGMEMGLRWGGFKPGK